MKLEQIFKSRICWQICDFLGPELISGLKCKVRLFLAGQFVEPYCRINGDICSIVIQESVLGQKTFERRLKGHVRLCFSPPNVSEHTKSRKWSNLSRNCSKSCPKCWSLWTTSPPKLLIRSGIWAARWIWNTLGYSLNKISERSNWILVSQISRKETPYVFCTTEMLIDLNTISSKTIQPITNLKTGPNDMLSRLFPKTEFRTFLFYFHTFFISSW